jgi:hypothetical protein
MSSHETSADVESEMIGCNTLPSKHIMTLSKTIGSRLVDDPAADGHRKHRRACGIGDAVADGLAGRSRGHSTGESVEPECDEAVLTASRMAC